MKTAVILAVASLATAFVMPDNDQQLLAAFTMDKEDNNIGNVVQQQSNNEVSKDEPPVQDTENRPSLQEWLDLSVLADGIEKDVAHFEEMEIQWVGKGESLKEAFGYRKSEVKKMIDDQGRYEEEAETKHHRHHHHRLRFLKRAIRKLLSFLGFSNFTDDYNLLSHHGHHPHGHPHHDCSDKSIYELISSNKHTKILTRIIDHHEEIVKILNSTSHSNYTVFVPIDSAFKNMRHHPHPDISKEDVLHWLQYHISPEVFTAHDFLDVQTVPTLRHQKTKTEDPQRISTSISRTGLTLNFYSHVIRSDIEATNGIIHALDKLLIPAMPTKTVVQAVPAVFSTLELALIKTGLIDHLNSTVGGTFFAPSNNAFARLPPQVNAFLFSSAGTKYLKALLKYHAVPGHVVFTDAYYKTKSGGDDGDDNEDSLVAKKHYELPTALKHKPVMIDIRSFHRLTLVTVNQRTPVAAANVPVAEGVIHILPSILIPPHRHHHDHDEQGDESSMQDLSVTDLMERLEPYLA